MSSFSWGICCPIETKSYKQDICKIKKFQTFIYLFAPICHNIRETDFDANLRLQNGKKIWSAMWEYKHPDVDCFVAPVSILPFSYDSLVIWIVRALKKFQAQT